MPQMKSPELTAKLKALLEEKRADPNAAYGAAFYVDGQLVTAFGGGTVDGGTDSPAVSTESLFNIGSVSKVYCSLAVMKLVELGLAELDVPVYTYLPRLTMRDARYRQITLRMCLQHSSGLPGTLMNRLFGSAFLGEGLYDEVYSYLERSVLKAEPGTYSVYCNDGFTLAEMVVAQRSGMSYAEFLQTHITGPAGAVATYTGETHPGDANRVRENGKPQETLSLAGSGGLISTLSDCALVGTLFIDGRQVLTQSSIDEIAKAQGLTFLENEVAGSFGFGWDSVAFAHPEYAFGRGVLMKSGGTLQFSTYLLVCPELGLSAAMSATMSNAIDVLAELCTLCAVLMEELGRPVDGTPPEPVGPEQPLPPGFAEEHGGIYHNFMGAYEISFPEGKLTIKSYADGAMQDMIPGAVYDGQWFNFGPLSFGFQHHGGRYYLMQKGLIGSTAFAETVPWEEPVPEDWAALVGKRYIACGFDPRDIGIGAMYAGLTIERLEESNLLLLCSRAPFLPAGTLPVAFAGGEATMPLNAPGGAGSRDQFAPLKYERDGIQYIYDRSYTYRDADSLEDLPLGDLALAPGTHPYRIPDGPQLRLAGGDPVRCIVLDEHMGVRADGPTGQALPEGGQFLILACDRDTDLRVEETHV